MAKGYTVTKVYIPCGDHRMKLLILRPTARKQSREKTPGILWIHGGGYAVGMAGITSAEEQAVIADLLASSGAKNLYWIGLDESIESLWITGEVSDYTNWCPGEPNASGDKYGEIYRDSAWSPAYTWNDSSNAGGTNFHALGNHGLICEFGDVIVGEKLKWSVGYDTYYSNITVSVASGTPDAPNGYLFIAEDADGLHYPGDSAPNIPAGASSATFSIKNLQMKRAKEYKLFVLPAGVSLTDDNRDDYFIANVVLPLWEGGMINAVRSGSVDVTDTDKLYLDDQIEIDWDGSYGVETTQVVVTLNGKQIEIDPIIDKDGPETVKIDSKAIGAKEGDVLKVTVTVSVSDPDVSAKLTATGKHNAVEEDEWEGKYEEHISTEETVDRNEIIDQLVECIESDAFMIPYDVMQAYAEQRGGLSAYTSVCVDIITNSSAYLSLGTLSLEARLHVLNIVPLIEEMDNQYYVETVNEANEFLTWLLDAEVDSDVKSSSKFIKALYENISPIVLEGPRIGSTFQHEYMKALETSINKLSAENADELKVLLYSYNTAANKDLKYDRFISGVKGVGDALDKFAKALDIIDKAVDARDIFKDYSANAAKLAVLMDTVNRDNDSIYEAITYLDDYYTSEVVRGIETGAKWAVDYVITAVGRSTWALFTSALKVSPAEKIAGNFVSTVSLYELSEEMKVDLFNGIEILRLESFCTHDSIDEVRKQCHAWIEIHMQAATDALNLTADATMVEVLNDLIALEEDCHDFCDEKLDVLISLLK